MGNRERQQVRIVTPPPDTEDLWARDVTDALNTLPQLSTFSYDTPESNVSAIPGTVGSNIKDGAAAVWIKESGDTTTGWSSVATSAAYDQISQISQQMALDVAYGGLSFGKDSNSSTRITGIGTTDVQWTAWDEEMPTLNMTSDLTRGYITVETTGVYDIEFSSSFSGTANTEFNSHVYVNGVLDYSYGFHRKLGTGGDVGDASWCGLIALSSGDTITPSITASSGAGNFIGIRNAQFALSLVHPT